jgi:epoxyqueuosine reductase
MADPNATKLVRRLAQGLGLHTVRFAAIGPTPELSHYDAWLAAGRHGEMTWLERGRDARADPRTRLPGARSVAVFALEHHHRRPPDPGGCTGLVARYAWGRDYHNLLGKRVRKLRARLREAGIDSWGGVDTAPILERAWARAAGLGFTGKNCVTILPARTSWLFLGVLFLDAAAAPDTPLPDHCGRCERCLVACPTGAFLGPRQLDATQCIAYWTIEARGLPPRALRPAFGRWVFGCDRCQEVCPHNAAPPDPEEGDLLPRFPWLDLGAVLRTPDEVLMEQFLGTPLRRAGAPGLKRNALIVMGNLADPESVPVARTALQHRSPVVRAAAIWCLGRLDDGWATAHRDPHPLVQQEVHAVMNGESTPAERA